MIYSTLNKTALFILVLSAITSCNSDKNEQQFLFDEVMEIHDQIMPEMGNLKTMAAKLSQKADSLATDTLNDHSQQIDEMRSLSGKLKDANESMMRWMRQFEQAEEGTPHEEVMEYLTKQRQQIQKVSETMLTSKEEAEKYLMNE